QCKCPLTHSAGSNLSDGVRRWDISRAVFKGSAGQIIGLALCRAVNRRQQSKGQGSLLAGQRTGVTAGRAEDKGQCWQGRGQGSLLAGQRTGVTAARALSKAPSPCPFPALQTAWSQAAELLLQERTGEWYRQPSPLHWATC
ncbi:unnamed protein product, partial [Staurois parvus]